MFPDATRVPHAPILMGDQAVGVVDIRVFDGQPFPRNLADVIAPVGRRIGVHLHMFDEFKKIRHAEQLLRKALREKARAFEDQAKAFEDFQHRISNPIPNARSSLEEGMAQNVIGRDFPNSARSNLRRAEQVANNIRRFVGLAQGTLPRLDQQNLRPATLTGWLENAFEDLRNLRPNRKLIFRLDQPSFAILERAVVPADADLLHHCLMNLLDNAHNYSSLHSEVSVRASRFEQNDQEFFALSVSNKVNEFFRITSANKDSIFRTRFPGLPSVSSGTCRPGPGALPGGRVYAIDGGTRGGDPHRQPRHQHLPAHLADFAPFGRSLWKKPKY